MALENGGKRSLFTVPETTLPFGFSNHPIGTHGSRTMMLAELRLLLGGCPNAVDFADYRAAIVADNLLLKRTMTTRKESLRRLRELYALAPRVLLFHALHDLWSSDDEAQPAIALLCATARDPLLRATTDLILDTPSGAVVTPHDLAATAAETFPGRYNPTMLANIGRHAASSWQQSGHLSGRLKKVRSRASSRPAALAYALLLGHLCGDRGERLFDTLWSRLLDAPAHQLREQATAASRLGWIEFRSAGGIIDVGFRHLLRNEALER